MHCTGAFEIRIAFKNKKDNVINKMIEQIIVISKVFIPDLGKWISKLSNFSIRSFRANPYRKEWEPKRNKDENIIIDA